MTWGKKTGGRDFKKGHPGYRKKSALSQRNLQKMTHEQIEEVGQMVLEGDKDGLIAISKDPNASVLKVWIASCAVKAINKGDYSTLDNMLNRIVGKVPNKHEFTGNVYSTIMDYIDGEVDPEGTH